MRTVPGGGLQGLVLVLALAGCATSPTATEGQRRAAAGDLPGARAALERERDAAPGSADLRVALGEVYYRSARDALDRQHDEALYLDFLGRSVEEFVVALELEPRDDRPHFFLAMIDVYRGELSKALRGFRYVLRLQPSGLACTNIAEIYLYMGRTRDAREWNDHGLRNGAPYGAGLFNDMLIAWREGDLDGARGHFARLKANAPEMLRTINDAALPEAPRRFEDFAAYCCGSPACGPFMQQPCAGLSLAVRERELSEDARRRELRIEMEAERRVEKVYEQRRELKLEPTPEELR